MTVAPKTCFFTGHRFIGFEEAREVKSRLTEELLNVVNGGYTNFISGGAVGFDTLAAEQVILLRENYDMLKLCLYLPCINHSRNWRENDKIRFERIFSLADEIYYVSEERYKEGCMKKRNSAMVNASDLCIAFLKNVHSGTAQTVKMAEDKGLRIVNIADRVKL